MPYHNPLIQGILDSKSDFNLTIFTLHYSSTLITAEVEQLLEPEERAILQQNVTPNLEKISSVSQWLSFCLF